MGLGDRFKNTECVIQTLTENNIIQQINQEDDITEVLNIDSPKTDLQQYLEDNTITKIVISGDTTKIYKNNNQTDKITFLTGIEEFTTGQQTVFRYIKDGFTVSGVLPPVVEKPCVTFEKINFFSPEQLVINNILTQKTVDFLKKSIIAHKNIIIAGDKNSTLVNTIVTYLLKTDDIVLLEEFNKIKSSDNITSFDVVDINASDFEKVLNVAVTSYSDYFVSDISDEIKIAKTVSKTHNLRGKIFSLPAENAHSALFRMLNMIMTEDHCNEKIAKSKLLNSFNYIIDRESLYIITPAKTAVLTLKEVPS